MKRNKIILLSSFLVVTMVVGITSANADEFIMPFGGDALVDYTVRVLFAS